MLQFKEHVTELVSEGKSLNCEPKLMDNALIQGLTNKLVCQYYRLISVYPRYIGRVNVLQFVLISSADISRLQVYQVICSPTYDNIIT